MGFSVFPSVTPNMYIFSQHETQLFVRSPDCGRSSSRMRQHFGTQSTLVKQSILPKKSPPGVFLHSIQKNGSLNKSLWTRKVFIFRSCSQDVLVHLRMKRIYPKADNPRYLNALCCWQMKNQINAQKLLKLLRWPQSGRCNYSSVKLRVLVND